MALAVIGTLQLVIGAAQLVGLRGVGDWHGLGGHLSSEFAAWNAAIGAGFTYVAARRGDPGALVPLLTVLLATLTLLYLADISDGDVTVTRLVSHVFLVLGYLIVVSLARRRTG